MTARTDRLPPTVVAVVGSAGGIGVTADGQIQLDRSEVVHHVRPTADVLLLLLAREYHGRCLAVVLAGTGIDGAAGTAAVKRAGGVVVARDEATAEHFGMPGAAILAGGVDEVLPLEDIGSAVAAFVKDSA